ncbi:hypothetical protein QN372_06240 [Undibacterium sp. RTI2.1]|uniref:anti-sigma factor family protein n=1 Tax=unclassified Undibacterium TaxID=2630295 RepID=UPI002AB5DBF8|nr:MULTISPECIES: hypothetical protein [unclassified Undibacterium]MDY7540162.1 hypothetical protein [Undibacterium sp. 5I1]MEB0030336.1 hypothetical protein [Undibacterium sp. RTI2.1]MEB0115384.1 hypothetical protein [Undibacterium sp. RTI2.2]MEB0230591.1 hypothetical protein [Undibacterium sp. 10I3]MEB0257089.1 hypothetical protein [Undibacterium sp. 5I1]
MRFSDETLMAFADGELDAETRATIQAAILQDADLAQRVGHHQAIRNDVFAAFAPIVDEPVPARLKLAATQTTSPSASAAIKTSNNVLQFNAAKNKDALKKPTSGWSWQQLGGLAAMLIVGVVVGKFGWQDGTSLSPNLSPNGGMLASVNGQVTAQGKLAQALTQQLASAPAADSTVKIGVSFLSKEGQFCRSFLAEDGTQNPGFSGLACKQKTGNDWQIAVLAQTDKPAASSGQTGQSGQYRQAAAEMPAAVLQAIDQRIADQALDAAAERAAQQHAWRNAP